MYNKIAKLIEKFIGGDCEVKYSDMFSYEPIDEVITFTFGEDEFSNREWKKFLAEKYNFTLTKENIFAMSILHELGHHYTVDLFSDEQWEEEATESSLLGLTGAERHQAYFNLPIERAATEWAVMVYKENPKAMLAWNHRFACAIKHCEKKAKRTLLTNV